MLFRNAAYATARTGFRLANRVLNPLGMLLSTPQTIHGSPAFSGAPAWSRKLWDTEDALALVSDVDGAIVESGVHWGYGILAMLHATRTRPRHIYGFDSFAGHSPAVAADRKGGRFLDLHSSFAVTIDQVWRTLELGTGLTQQALGETVTLTPGWLHDTLPRFAKNGPRIAFAQVDPDFYEPVKATLENIWPLLAPGGVMLLGKLNNPELAGKTEAVREFMAGLANGAAELCSRNVGDARSSQTPMAYLVKARHVSLSRVA